MTLKQFIRDNRAELDRLIGQAVGDRVRIVRGRAMPYTPCVGLTGEVLAVPMGVAGEVFGYAVLVTTADGCSGVLAFKADELETI